MTYTVTPLVAPPLPLPFNATLHQPLQAGAADPVVGSMGDVTDLLLTVRASGVCWCACASVGWGWGRAWWCRGAVLVCGVCGAACSMQHLAPLAHTHD